MAAGTTNEREPLLVPATPSGGGLVVANGSNDASYGAISRSESSSTLDGTEELGKPDDAVDKVSRKFSEIWAVCLGLSTAVFCSALGATIVANVQVDIGSYFRAGSLSSWLGTAYLLGLAGMTPLYGRLAQVMGRKGAMLLAVSLYSTGTVGCALAPSMLAIILARGIAGMGSGGILTVTAIIITDLVSIADRGLYQGGVNVLYGAGAATGAVLGGAVADAIGWRAAFWIQVPPIAIATALIIAKVDVPHIKGELSAWEKFKRIDWLGCGVLVTSVSCLSVACSMATSSGLPWSHPLVVSLLAVAVITVPLFLLIERRAAEPILPLTLLTRSQPSLVLFGLMALTGANFSRLYMQPVYLHVTRGLNGRETGLVLLPSSIVGSAASLYAGWHMRHYREYKWFQFVVSLVPWLQALSILSSWNMTTNIHRLWIELAFGALGGGAVITSMLTSLIACVETHELSLAISACYLFRSLGQVIGVAIAAAIQQAILARSLSQRLSGVAPDLVDRIIQEPATIIPRLEDWMQVEAKLSYLESVDGVFGFIVVLGVVLSGVCISLRAHSLK